MEKSEEKMRIRKGGLWVVAVFVGLFFNVHTHLGNSFGDWLFRFFGISPWTAQNNTGLYLPNNLGILVLIVGFIGAIRHLKPVYPKITSWLIGGSFVFVLLFPYVTQASMFLLKYNATGYASVAITDSQCNIRQDEQSADMSCTLTLYNYGKETEITLHPILPADLSERMNAVFESNSLRLIPHRTNTESVSFTSGQQSGNVFTGNIRNVKFQVSTGPGR
jgi:hypothetical protein